MSSDQRTPIEYGSRYQSISAEVIKMNKQLKGILLCKEIYRST